MEGKLLSLLLIAVGAPGFISILSVALAAIENGQGARAWTFACIAIVWVWLVVGCFYLHRSNARFFAKLREAARSTSEFHAKKRILRHRLWHGAED